MLYLIVNMIFIKILICDFCLRVSYFILFFLPKSVEEALTYFFLYNFLLLQTQFRSHVESNLGLLDATRLL